MISWIIWVAITSRKTLVITKAFKKSSGHKTDKNSEILRKNKGVTVRSFSWLCYETRWQQYNQFVE